MTVIRTAIIGQGRSGRDIHGAYLSKVPEQFRIVAVVDPLEERLRRAKSEYGCETYSDYNSLKSRSDLDLIVNSSPSRFHVPITLDLLQSGFNVLCEKPIARRASDVDRLCEASRSAGKLFAVFQQSRYSPGFCKIRQLIDSGVLGRVVRICISYNGFSRRYDWQTLTREMGGNLLNTGPHPLDQALVLFGGDDMPEVDCAMQHVLSYGDADDHTLLTLTGPGRPTVQLEITSCCALPGPTYSVWGTQGGIRGDAQRLEIKYYNAAAAPELNLITQPIAKPDGTPSYCTDSLEWIQEEWRAPESPGLFPQMCGDYYSMLYRSLTTGAPLEVTLPQVRRQIAVIEESLRQNPHIWGAPE